MEQDTSGMRDTSDLPKHLPNDTEEPGSAELAADLVREQATGPVPLGPTIPGQGEDTVLLVETGMLPDQTNTISSEEMVLEKPHLEKRVSWYRSPWLYAGASLAGGAALAVGAVLLFRNRRVRQQTVRWRTQRLLNQWSRQVSRQTNRIISQTSKLSRQIAPLTRQVQRRSSMTRRLTGQINQLPSQASQFSNQAQKQMSRLASRTQQVARLPRQPGTRQWLRRAQRQLAALSQQAGSQVRFIGSAVSTTTRAATQALGKTQQSLGQVREGVAKGIAAGAARTGASIKSGWKFSRNFTIGMTAGAVWAAFFTPQSGEATRQRLKAILPVRLLKKH